MTEQTAVVVGLCAHGLTMARALSKAGIRVVSVEANRTRPGARTLAAETVFVDDITGPGLVDSLRSIAHRPSITTLPVLLLTNDTMVETIGKYYESLCDLYRISWGHCRTQLLPLLHKDQVRRRCADIGMLHAKSALINAGEDIDSRLCHLKFPLIVKPDKPLSGYKTLLVENMPQLRTRRKIIESSLPALAQEFIPGSDAQIYFAALYLDHGEVVARYEGRKLRARPMGQTTVAIGESNNQTHQLARRFFSGLELSGPVSLELKADAHGRFWVIEPTLGRTDYWVGLCVKDGVNLPLIECFNARQREVIVGNQRDCTVWINEERDPGAALWLARHYPVTFIKKHRAWVYIGSRDYRPFLRWASTGLPARGFKKLLKGIRPQQQVKKAQGA